MAQETVVVQPTGQHALAVQATLVRRAVTIFVTLKHTDSVSTPHFAWAALVVLAGVWHPDALHLGSSNERWWAGANLLVFLRSALSVQTAGVALGARSLAFALDANLKVPAVDICDTPLLFWCDTAEVLTDRVSWAVLVGLTKLLDTTDLFVIGVAEVPLWAGALGSMV